MTSPLFDRSPLERKEAQAQNVSIKMFLARARDSSTRGIDDRDEKIRATQLRMPSFIKRLLGGAKNSSRKSTDGRDAGPLAIQLRMTSFKGGFSIPSPGGMGKEAVERPAPRRFTNIFLKLLLLGCFAALTTFFICAFPLLRTDLVQVVLPDQALGLWHKDATSLDYIARNSDAKSAALKESLLTFAANDPSFETDNNRAKLLMDESNFDTRSRAGRFRYPTRGHTVVEMGRSRDRRGSRFEPWLLQIQSQRYQTSWPKFRRLLQSWIRKKRYDPHVMNEMVQTLKKPMDDFYRSNFNQEANEGARYKTCAVVGNSGILLNKTYGTFIDSHDIVIRLNNAKIAPYAESVGTKTTISFLNSNVYYSCGRRLKCFCHPYGAVPIVMYVCQVQQLMDLVYCEPHQPAPVLVTDPRFDVLCARIVKWYSVKRFVEVTGNPIQMWEKEHSPKEFHYSSGFQAVMLALATCDKVDLLGFGKATDSKHHYHSSQKQELDLHDYEAEYLFYDDLVYNRTASIPYLTEGGAWIPPVDIYR